MLRINGQGLLLKRNMVLSQNRGRFSPRDVGDIGEIMPLRSYEQQAEIFLNILQRSIVSGFSFLLSFVSGALSIGHVSSLGLGNLGRWKDASGACGWFNVC